MYLLSDLKQLISWAAAIVVYMKEWPTFCLCWYWRNTWWWRGRGVDELEDEWPACDDALPTRKEVTTYDPTSQQPEVNGENSKNTDGWLMFQAWRPTVACPVHHPLKQTTIRVDSLWTKFGGCPQRGWQLCPRAHSGVLWGWNLWSVIVIGEILSWREGEGRPLMFMINQNALMMCKMYCLFSDAGNEEFKNAVRMPQGWDITRSGKCCSSLWVWYNYVLGAIL